MPSDLGPNHQYIESRLSESMFRRYEPLFDQAIKGMPNETEFPVPTGMAPTTFLARLRDARISAIKFNWTTYIDRDKLIDTLNGSEKWIFTLNPDHRSVWFRRKQLKGRPTELKTAGITSSTITPTGQMGTLSSLRDEEWHAIAVLVHFGRLPTPILAKGEPPPAVKLLEESMNISFVSDLAKGETIIT